MEHIIKQEQIGYSILFTDSQLYLFRYFHIICPGFRKSQIIKQHLQVLLRKTASKVKHSSFSITVFNQGRLTLIIASVIPCKHLCLIRTVLYG